MTITSEEREALKVRMLEVLAVADWHDWVRTGARLTEALDALMSETERD